MNRWTQILFPFLLVIISCNTDDDFPDVYINESIYITGPEYLGVYNNLWAYKTEPGGVGGLIIVQGMNNEFIAYDQACTLEANSECIVSGETNAVDVILSCKDCCNSKFVINDGSVIEGPANRALKRYNTYFDGTILYVTN
tara:strand:+ start:208 stop:630 length:423 start_codon:yes stop_codon:yes gene_type:complete